MRRRTPLIVVAVVLFAGISIVLGRFLAVEGQERDLVAEALEQREGAGIVVIRTDSQTAYALSATEGWSRVVWATDPDAEPRVQCFRIRRDGNALTGTSVTLIRVQPPLRDNEASC